jgi:hypothetical protein
MSRLLVAAVCLLPALATVTAQDRGPVIRKGDFDGLWTGTKTKFSVQEVHDNDTFDGVAELLEGPFAGIKFGFHGKLGKDGSLVVTRYVAGDTQVARVGPPRVADGHHVWAGETKGVGIPEGPSWPFELRVPNP